MSLKSDRKEREFDRGIDRFAVQHGKRIVERALEKKKKQTKQNKNASDMFRRWVGGE